MSKPLDGSALWIGDFCGFSSSPTKISWKEISEEVNQLTMYVISNYTRHFGNFVVETYFELVHFRLRGGGGFPRLIS